MIQFIAARRIEYPADHRLMLCGALAQQRRNIVHEHRAKCFSSKTSA